MRLIFTCMLALFLASPVRAQATTAIEIAAFPPSVTSPITGVPLATPVIYPIASVLCNQTKAAEVIPIINPGEYRIDDPANLTTRDCSINIAAQFDALPVGAGYHAAWRNRTASGPLAWSPLGTAFSIEAAQTHPCDGTPPTTGTAVEGTRTLSWCWDGLDANGNPTVILNWVITIDGVRSTPTSVTVGTTVNAQGKRLYSAPITLARGVRSIRVAGVNSVGEAPLSATFQSTVAAPLTVPSVAEIRGIQ